MLAGVTVPVPRSRPPWIQGRCAETAGRPRMPAAAPRCFRPAGNIAGIASIAAGGVLLVGSISAGWGLFQLSICLSMAGIALMTAGHIIDGLRRGVRPNPEHFCRPQPPPGSRSWPEPPNSPPCRAGPSCCSLSPCYPRLSQPSGSTAAAPGTEKGAAPESGATPVFRV